MLLLEVSGTSSSKAVELISRLRMGVDIAVAIMEASEMLVENFMGSVGCLKNEESTQKAQTWLTLYTTIQLVPFVRTANSSLPSLSHIHCLLLEMRSIAFVCIYSV